MSDDTKDEKAVSSAVGPEEKIRVMHIHGAGVSTAQALARLDRNSIRGDEWNEAVRKAVDGIKDGTVSFITIDSLTEIDPIPGRKEGDAPLEFKRSTLADGIDFPQRVKNHLIFDPIPGIKAIVDGGAASLNALKESFERKPSADSKGVVVTVDEAQPGPDEIALRIGSVLEQPTIIGSMNERLAIVDDIHRGRLLGGCRILGEDAKASLGHLNRLIDAAFIIGGGGGFMGGLKRLDIDEIGLQIDIEAELERKLARIPKAKNRKQRIKYDAQRRKLEMLLDSIHAPGFFVPDLDYTRRLSEHLGVWLNSLRPPLK